MKCENVKCDKNLSPLQEKDGLRFCSRACSCSSVIRLSKQSSRDKVGKSLSATILANPRHEKVTLTCGHCGKSFTVRYGKRNIKGCTFKCSKLIAGKTSAIVKTQNGTHSGWQKRTKEPSYPEKYFMSVFENENILGWTKEKKVGRWFIDFAFQDKMIAVEIDGRQHQDEERKMSDIQKDIFLKSLGWTVIRIPWSNPKNEIGKSKLYPHVYNLLAVLRE